MQIWVLIVEKGGAVNWRKRRYSSAGPSDEAEKYVVLIGEDSEIIEELSDIDLLVIDAEYFSQNDIARLRENGIRETYSYINIGSIESFRSYDTDFEKYTLGAYENWPEEKWIDVSAPEWQACTASRVDALVQKGVDGFFVDNTDVYYNYPQESSMTESLRFWTIWTIQAERSYSTVGTVL